MSMIVQVLAKKALKDAAVKNINGTDPFYEQVPIYDRQGRLTGKSKKQKRGIPEGLSAHDSAVLTKVRKSAYRLDMSLFNCCGIKFGWSSLIGIVPVIGDAIDCLFAMQVVRSCAEIEGGLPDLLRARMFFNVMLDFGIGLVPFIGDIADALYRANTRNAWLLESYLVKKAEAERKGQVVDPDSGKTLQMPAAPTPAATRFGTGMFGKRRQPDEEMAVAVADNGVRGAGKAQTNQDPDGGMETGIINDGQPSTGHAPASTRNGKSARS